MKLTKEVRATGRDWKTCGRDEVYRFPDDWTVREYRLAEASGLGPEEIARALSAEFAYGDGATTLAALAGGKSDAVVLVDDLARPTPAHDIVPHVLKTLLDAGVPGDRITFIVANGLRRPMTRDEMALKLGEGTARECAIETHDGFYGDYVDVGTTPRGTRVRANRKVAEAGLVVSVSTIAKDPFVGATGGADMVLPGVSSRGTILSNRKGIARDGRPDAYGSGEVRLDVDEAAKLLGERTTLVAASVTLNALREVTSLHIGDCARSFRENVDEALGKYVVPFRKGDHGAAGRADIGFFRMGFHSCDALQMDRCTDGWDEVCSVPVVISDCRDGLFYDGTRDGTWDEFEEWLRGQADPGNPSLRDAVASGKCNIVYSPHLDETSTHQKHLRMYVAHDWDSLIAELYDILGPDRTVAFFHDASMQVLDVG